MPLPRRSLQGEWPGPAVFVLAVAGASIGFGNLWRFPALMAEHGGGAFLMLYLGCVLLLGLPLLVAEILVGKGGRQNPVSAYSDLALLHGHSVLWAWVARIGLAAAVVLLLLLTLLGAWALGYAFRSMTGAMVQLDVIDTLSLFQNLQGDVERSLLWVTMFIAVLVCVVSQGLRHGLVPATVTLVPGLFLGLLVLLLLAGSLPASTLQVFASDFSRIGSEALVAALQHAFYTLTIATGAAVAMAAYLPERSSPLLTALGVVALDTIAAVMGAMFVVALLDNAGIVIMSGPTLVFQALPVAFGQLPWGSQMATLFYLVLGLGALTTGIALMEAVVTPLIERRGVTRGQASIAVGIGLWLLALLLVLSQALSWRGVGGFSPFELVNLLVTHGLLPLSALLIAVFVGWVLSSEALRYTMRWERGWGFMVWYGLLRLGTPVLVLLVAAANFGFI